MTGPQTVKRRKVFYVPGYDPIHPRRYRELYRRESADQAQISGYEISQTAKSGKGGYGWHVSAKIDGCETQADVEVLVWSDIVRGSMSQTIPATYARLLRTAYEYIATGALFRLMRLRKGPVIAALYPVGMLLLQLFVAIGIGSAVAAIPVNVVGGILGTVIAIGAFAAIVVLVLRWFKSIDGKLFAYYLMHDYAYSAHWRGANPPQLETRMAEFAGSIIAAQEQGYDEILVVGHSSGAHLSVSILADLLRADHLNGTPVSFLSLGQVIPMVSFLRDAWRLRADLEFMAAQDQIAWVDVTAPGDGCAFALCDPVSVTGVAPQDKKWPLVMSAAFTQSLSAARWKELRWKFFRLHFQYLCAFDRPKDYDYFQITAGPITLRERYADRPPSRSRKETPASRFISVAP
ncbi:hypothetical protein BVC71_05665 [Marivivens niveibacter]|uniref:Fungal lipase-like domain-containing protein n=1 Tax=Marivivens niveibacter TaxID=1930667 RepID=A0A251X2K6_9RHOB|nr:hypothetical protein [Marivivens niveibacter]OUD10950.1 hypothetical protein BVC71_05665 [Marivivens niveibacter]